MAVSETSRSLVGLFIPLVGSSTNYGAKKIAKWVLRRGHTALLPSQCKGSATIWLFFCPSAPQTCWAGTYRRLKSLESGTDRQTHAHRPDKVHFLRQPAYQIKGNIWGYTAPFLFYPIPRDLGAETCACSNSGCPSPTSRTHTPACTLPSARNDRRDLAGKHTSRKLGSPTPLPQQ